MARTYNGICKAGAVPLLIQQFALAPDERVENWMDGNGMRFRACQSGRVFLIDFTNPSCVEIAKETVPDYVSGIISEGDTELGERYYRVTFGDRQDPNEFLAAHSEMAVRGIGTLDTLDRLQREKRGPAFG